MDELAALALQMEWGADEALDERPLDRRSEARVAARPRPAAVPAVAAPAVAAGTPGARAEALAAAAADLAALHAALAGLDCALRHTATSLVFAEGDPATPVTLVADVPGAAEDRAGTPFAGPAGAFLDRMLGSIGLQRQGVYACSLLPWRPPGDRKPAEAEVAACLPFLHRHLALVRPARVVVLGALGVRTLLPGAAGRRPRGGWHALAVPGLEEPVPALALASPAALQANPAAKREAWADLLRLRRALDGAAVTGS